MSSCELRLSAALTAVVLVAAHAPQTQASVVFQRVYVTGDSVPSIGVGVHATAYGLGPVINSSGTVCFQGMFAGSGVTSTNDRALFAETSGALTPLLRAGSQVPGAAAGVTTDSGWFNPNFSDSGAVAVYELLTGTGIGSSNNKAIVYGQNPSLVAQTGPSTGSNIASVSPPIINASGRYAYLTNFVTGGPTRGLWFGSPSQAPSPVALIGDHAPGYASTAHFSFLTTPTISDSGRLSFLSGVMLTPSTATVTLYAGSPGNFQKVAALNDPVPTVPGSTFFEFDETPSMNRNGDLAYSGWYQVGGTSYLGVFAAGAGNPGQAAPVYLPNKQTPPLAPAGSAPSSVWDVSVGDSGAVAFRATLAGGGITAATNDGLWMSRGGTLTNISREGMAVPGMPAGVVQGQVFKQSAVNSRDQVAFILGLTGVGVGPGNANALCAWDPGLGLMPLLREGDLFTVAPGDIRTISVIDFVGSRQGATADSAFNPAGTGGLASGFNDAGLLVAGLRFTNGTYGIFETTIPGPVPAAIFLPLGIFASRRSTRRTPPSAALA